MSNAIALISDLTYDTADLQGDPIGVYLEVTVWLGNLPTVRGEDDVVASRTGRVPYPRVADVLSVELHGYVMGIGASNALARASYRTLVASLQALFRRDRDPAVLAGTLEDGSTFTLNARPVDFRLDEPVPSLCGEVRIALESVDPYPVITP